MFAKLRSRATGSESGTDQARNAIAAVLGPCAEWFEFRGAAAFSGLALLVRET
jgi:hypothetical protein